ncbi:dihydrodipicolinate synthase family protein [Geodermatophilus obscurus]|uniref:Dihydrodipicolinate synthetase n=1 Tax=Geodermatophilus obscurus (strain ATCC 25078 / DSM 43160 / JCM 3152 / CCUG 61914 / KCC A-0152 / KCTC 9177 / NBRC 13315 / NRRL B-3577 / G-20) TaxID=526225 RepID=D2SD07_GEOOG|nr:dihydrodipicolinate synthase family protein [Geodermatophilus obscurus]ADB76356.1 dihydrodipicolinate synthetase [Geodermatophilus obscurus DSM 43160]
MTALTGVLPITLTPFTDGGDVDEGSIDSLVEDYLGAGAHGLTILGIMGEAARLLDDERERVLRRYLQATAGRVPVVAGVSARATRMALDYARRAEDAGAAAVMLAPPDNTRNLDLVFEHFGLVAEAVSVPVVVQDEPVNTGVVMPAPFLVRLLDEIEGCRYLKLEETPTLPKITAVRQKAKGPVGIFGGLGGLYLYEELLRGADGIMTGFGFPQVLVGTYERFVAGDRAGAQEFFFRYLPLIRYEAQLGVGGVTIRKQVFARRGAIASPHARFPAPPVDELTLAELDDLIAAVGL